MDMKEQFLTREGLEEMRDKLNELKTVKRREIADAIHAAKEQGDLSENAEYVQAKEEQHRIEEQIAEIELTIKHAQIITDADTRTVSIGNTVVLQCEGQERTYRIVGSNEADPMQGKISNESPMGKALMDKKKNDEVAIPTPIGEKRCKVVDIK
jgi:transcription elongation factor GreA